MYTEQARITPAAIREILNTGVKKIAPLWSLENFVAVNPYLGLAGEQFASAMDFLQKTGKTKATLPVDFYLQALEEGHMNHSDLANALRDNKVGINYDVEEFLMRLPIELDQSSDETVKIFADVAGATLGKQWSRFMVDRISFWASAYFDHEQAGWDTAKTQSSLFKAWKQEAEIDRSTEVMGLKGFRKIVKKLPGDHHSAAIWALEILDISPEALPHYINALLMKINGWAGLAGRIDWDANLAGAESHCAEELLTIALVWEMCIHECLQSKELEQVWQKTKASNHQLATSTAIDSTLAYHLILQEAFDHANQRNLLHKINSQEATAPRHIEPKVQAIFCIDVRSELFRRNLEAANEQIETMGFAGFFAFPIEYVPLAHDHGTNQCPVLLTTSHTVEESLGDLTTEQITIEDRKLRRQVAKAWSSFKTGAISCFSFVSPVGLSYLPKLFTDSFGLTRPVAKPQEANLPASVNEKKRVRLNTSSGHDRLHGIPAEDRLRMAMSALKAMSLTDNFARIVLITGHGASTVNNPHATGLDCGACGGNSGEANAKVAAAVLNDIDVREGLSSKGIQIPDTTIFMAAMHDTTTDQVSLFNTDDVPASHRDDLVSLKYSLEIAGESARLERASRMNITKGDFSKQVLQRSKDWSQVRPEWGLAGCSSFIVAPRYRTEELDFGAKAFMHSYDWRKDTDFGVLELIMTAPMVVTSWINLQYYASSVDNKKFGSGNKTLHNVVGGLGVLEGFAGDLRVGLPMQSVHDGEQYQHEPQRLNVIIEAPVDEMSKILGKHESIRNLVDNHWIYLFAMNDEGKVAYKYIGNLEWEVI